MPRFYLWLFVLAAALYALHHAIFHFVFQWPMHGIYYAFYAYELILSAGMHVLLSRAIHKRPQSFVNTFMATMSVKMVVSLFVLMGAIAAFRDMMKPIAIVFVVLYFAFMVYSVLVMRQMSLAQTAKERAAREAAEG